MAERTDKPARRKSANKKGAGRRSPDKPVAKGPSVGERLRAAREKRDLSLKDAARELHLDHWMLEALERDDYAALGAPVFAKGHLRKYAALLEVPGDEVMIAYYQSESVADAPPIVSESLIRARRERPGRWLRAAGLVIVVSLAAAAAAWWFLARESGALRPVGADARSPVAVPVAEPATPGIAAPIPAVSDTARLEPTPALSSVGTGREDPEPPANEAALPTASGAAAGARAEAAAETVDTAPVRDTPAVAQPPISPRPDTTPAAPLEDGAIKVVLSFQGDSWVEINDASGRRLLYGMGNAGTSRTVTGQPPIQVFLGRARGVSLDVQDRPFEIPPAGLRGDTARFQIDAPR